MMSGFGSGLFWIGFFFGGFSVMFALMAVMFVVAFKKWNKER